MKQNLILLHGALGSSAGWNPISEKVSAEFNLFVPDLPGHGKTGTPAENMSLDGLIAFLKNYIAENVTGEYSVVGYSMGGYIALKYAVQHPAGLKKVITIATKFDWDPEVAAAESSKLSEENLLPLLPKLQEEHGENFKTILPLTQSILRSIGDDPLTQELLKKIEIPVTISLGDRDKMVTYDETKRFAGFIPNGNTDIFVNQPHLLQKMDAAIIGNFIRRTL